VLLDLGVTDTHVIEFSPRLMPRQIDDEGSHVLQSKLTDLGLTIHLNKSTSSIKGEHKLEALEFSDDSTLELDLLIISAGIRLRDELAKQSGLEVGAHGGITVNERLQTSDENIYAIGECALCDGMIYGLIAIGYKMAEIVAANLCGGAKTFKGFDMSTKLKLIGIDVASFGDPFVNEPDGRSIVFEDLHKVYIKE